MVGGLFFDLPKQFVCVIHDIRLAKMKFYGISFIANNLIMKNGKLNKLFSEREHVKHGVPQLSVLDPLLFLIYTNGLSLTMSKSPNPILFADDTSIIISNNNPEEFKEKY
jgi:hypothetical protein